MERFTVDYQDHREADVRSRCLLHTGWLVDLAKGGYVFDPPCMVR
jgi:hypothetical protein